jgi:hypothetical protein
MPKLPRSAELPAPAPTGMTSAERVELGKLVRLNAKVAKEDAEARGKWLLADAEAKLAARYKAEGEAWADITAAAQKAVEEADAAIAALCQERGIPPEFRPGLHLGWFDRGENASRQRRDELRKVAQTEVAARVKQAQVEIDRAAAEQLTRLAQAGLTSEEARAFLSTMPRPEQLLPPLDSLPLRNGKTVPLLTPVTAVTDVTPGDGAVMDSRNRCAFCGEPFTPSRSDGKYCKPACRVADYRRRLKESTS